MTFSDWYLAGLLVYVVVVCVAWWFLSDDDDIDLDPRDGAGRCW